jgi:hypothetical protein
MSLDTTEVVQQALQVVFSEHRLGQCAERGDGSRRDADHQSR